MRGRGVPSGYVEDLNEVRTLLADVFSILLDERMQNDAIYNDAGTS